MSDPREFDLDTAVAGGVATITDRWDIAGTPNGGYLMAILARAMGTSVTHPDPLSITAHYLRRVDKGQATLETTVLGGGRSTSVATASLRQGGITCVHAVATFGDLAPISVSGSEPSPSPRETDRYMTRTAPELPPPEQCLLLGAVEGTPEVFQRVELRVADDVGWPRGERTGRAEVSGWIRFADGRPPDPLGLAFFADAFPPALFDVVPRAWVPTLELTVHLRRRPVAGWIRGSFRTTALADGYLDEEGELWDESGELVAMSRQLARYRRPPADQPMV